MQAAASLDVRPASDAARFDVFVCGDSNSRQAHFAPPHSEGSSASVVRFTAAQRPRVTFSKLSSMTFNLSWTAARSPRCRRRV